MGVRPDDLTVGDGVGFLEGQVTVLEPLGAETLIYVTYGDTEVIARASGRHPPQIGDTVRLTADTESLHIFDQASGVALA